MLNLRVKSLFLLSPLILIIGYLVGFYMGLKKGFPYRIFRIVAEQVEPRQPKLQNHNKKGVVIFGDSLTVLADWSPLSKGHEVLVLARGGVKASEFCYKPSEYGGVVHTFWLGTNDLIREIDLTGALKSVTALAYDSHEIGKKVVILGVPIPIGIGSLARDSVLKFNDDMEAQCIKEGWIFIDTEEVLSSRFPKRSEISADGIHLSIEASAYIAEALNKEIVKLVNDL